jgi:uncharacterized protein (UPF0332 family)
MALNDEERKTMISLEIEKAERFLKQADMMTDMEQWDMAANRYYYACFHAVQALFIHKGLSSRRHKGMLTLFGYNLLFERSLCRN